MKRQKYTTLTIYYPGFFFPEVVTRTLPGHVAKEDIPWSFEKDDRLGEPYAFRVAWGERVVEDGRSFYGPMEYQEGHAYNPKYRFFTMDEVAAEHGSDSVLLENLRGLGSKGAVHAPGLSWQPFEEHDIIAATLDADTEARR